MIILRIGIYYEPQLQALAEYACVRLNEALPGIVSNLHASLAVPPAALDTATGQYDVRFLLDTLTVPPPYHKTIWIIKQAMGDCWQPYLFGAALATRAVVSAARLSNQQSLAKEVCHEVGHMLGLKHCRKHCCMRSSWTENGVAAKPLLLCADCRQTLGR